MPSWSVLLVAATALHAGFQLTVTALVYPALLRVGPAAFSPAHRRHSRAVTPVVAVVYGAVVVTSVGAAVTSPSAPVLLSTAASAVALLITAVRAAPLHGRLAREGPAPGLVRALLRADRVRCVAALLSLAAALLAAF